MVAHHAVEEGIHLRYALRSYPTVAVALLALIAVVTLGTVAYSRWRGWKAVDVLPANSALALWLLVSVYHRNYDSVVMILALVFLLSVIVDWKLAAASKVLLGLYYLLVVAVLCLPGDILESFVAHQQFVLLKIIIDRSITAAVIGTLGITLWLLLLRPRLAPPKELPSSLPVSN
jgi:hypothetical protein